ncbi:MAG TPA: hypothetical protein V6C76_13735 [Drouetiella sp.]
MTREGEESAWKGLFSYCTLGLVVAATAFWLTISKPEEIRVIPTEGAVHGMSASDASNQIYLCSQQVLTDVEAMEPLQAMRDGDMDLAIGSARALIDKDKWNVKNLMCAGDVFVAAPKDAGLQKEGYQDLQTAVHMVPASKWIRLNYARALARGERFEEAIEQYEKVTKDNLDIVPSLELARLYMDVDQDKALKLLHDLAVKSPDNSAVQMLLGIAMARNDEEKPGYEEYVQAYGKARAIGYPFEARDLVVKNHDSIPDAIKEQTDLVSKDKEDVDAKLMLAKMLIVQNKLPEARAVLDPEKEKLKDNAELHRLYAEIAHTDNKEDEALKEWAAANAIEKKID